MSRPAAARPSLSSSQILVGRLPEGMEPVAVADDPAEQARVHRLAPEPEARTVRAPGLGLEIDVLVGVVPAGERGGRLTPETFPRGEMLVEESAAPVERDARARRIRPGAS